MGALSPKRFREKYKASGGLYKGQDYETIALNKIKDKRPFILGSKDTGTKVYGLRLLRDKDNFLLDYTNSKSSTKSTGKKSVGGFFKDPDFGGGKGSGGGSDDTATTESMQCYYLSILFNTNVSKLDNKNTQLENLQAQDKFCFTFNKSNKLKAKDCYDLVPEDWFKNDVFIKSANAIYNSVYAKPFKGKKVYFHRNSPYMKAVYLHKKKAADYDKKVNKTPIAPGSFMDDKWNPGDIWMSTQLPTEKKPFAENNQKEPIEWTELREAVRDKADEHTLGISLKKAPAPTATVTPFNTRKRTHNTKTKFAGFTFGKGGDFFSSTDIYLHFDDGGQMQCRASQVTTQWQGLMTGKYAYAGKIGGGNINHYVEKIFNKSIGFSVAKGPSWRETLYRESNLKNMHKLYSRFINKQKPGIERKEVLSIEEFKKAADNYTSRGRNASASFYFAKYMNLLLLESISADKKGAKLDEFSRVIVRYAMSNTDISTFFIKVS